MRIPQVVRPYLAQINLPRPESHKGENGKVLIIGGSELFHAASKWSLDVVSKFVDMVFYSSVPINNQLIKEAKANFWNGIVVPRDELTNYLDEADCILLGPGMERAADTAQLSNQLLSKYGHKRWVLDAGALQMLEPNLLGPTHIITPHLGELKRLMKIENELTNEEILTWLRGVNQPTLLLKGPVDRIFINNDETKLVEVAGGNAGMTKGGTGDVLAGLVAAFYATQPQAASAVTASYLNKRAGDELYQQVGPFYNTSDLAEKVPQLTWKVLQQL